jgi:hypothetical protein
MEAINAMVVGMMNYVHGLVAGVSDSMTSTHPSIKGSKLAPSKFNRKVTAQVRF